MGGVMKDLAAVQAQFNEIQKSMVLASSNSKGMVDPKLYKDQVAKIGEVRQAFLEANAAQNGFRISSMQVATQTDTVTESLRRQKLTISDVKKNWNTLKAVYKEQMALRNSVLTSWTESNGKVNADMLIPKSLPAELRSLRSEVGFYSQVVASAAENTIKWGKNTQWAGRQLTVGFSVPLLAAAAATGVMAFQMDKSLTQIVKVYGNVGDASAMSADQIRADSIATAKTVAQAYGQSAKDTLDITAQLAASGKTGNDLQQATIAVTRARMLGELNLQDAIKATITLQSVYGASAADLTKDFDYMNAMENATVLTMQDFVEGIPRAAGILNTLGGTLQDLGTLLTAFKAGGIDAAEGANAIKSIAFKVLKPTAAAIKDFKASTNQDLEEIVNKGGSDLIAILVNISKAMKGLDPQHQAALFKDLFGIYQGSKAATAMIQLANATGQVGTAMTIANESADTWANVSAQEVIQQTTSLSGRFKRVVASIQVDLATIGQTALALALPVLEFVDRILKGFESLPDGAKKAGLFAAIFLAAIGPLVMFTGLFANMLGTLVRAGAGITNLIARFKILDTEERAQVLIQKQMTNTWDAQTMAVTRLNESLQKATVTLVGFAAEQRAAVLASQGLRVAPTTLPYVSGPAGPTTAYRGSNGKFAKASTHPANKSGIGVVSGGGPTTAAAAAKISAEAAKTEGLWSKISSHSMGIGLAAGAMGTMVTSSGSLLNNLSNAAFAAALIGPTIAKSKIGTIVGKNISFGVQTGLATLGKTKAFGAITKGASAAKGAVAGMLPVLGGMAAGFGIAALAAGVAYMQIQKATAKTRAEIQQADDSAKDWAGILGFAFTTAGEKVDATGKKIDTLTSIVDKFKAANSAAADAFIKMQTNGSTDAEKMTMAIQEGIKVIMHGGTAAAAQQATAAALKLMGSTLSAADLQVKIKANIDFNDKDDVIRRQVDGMTKSIQDAVDNNLQQSHWEGFARIFTGSDDINQAGGQKIKDVAKEMWNTFGKASDEQKNQVFDQLAAGADKDSDALFTTLSTKYSAKFKAAGINSMSDLLGFKGAFGRGTQGQAGLGLDNKDVEQVTRMKAAMQQLIQEFAKAAGIDPKLVENMFNFDALGKFVKISAPGVEALKDVQDHFSRMADAANGATMAVNGTSEAMVQIADAAEATSTLKSVFSGAMNDIYSGAASIMQDQLSAKMNGIQKNADAWNKAFSSRQDAWSAKWDRINDRQKDKEDKRAAAVTAAYDKRIAAVDKAIKAEEDADAMRQKIFDAEKTRIQRMSEMFSKNIDFNSALNSGNLDEAAKVGNDIMATQSGWAIDDAAASGSDASQARIDKLNGQKDNLGKQKDAALDHLKVVDKAEETALKATQDRQKKAMDAEKARYDAGTKAAQDAATQQNAINQRMLDAQLNTLKAYTPRNQAELDAQIKRVQAAYAKYGINLQAQGTGWGQIVGSALSNNVAVAAAGLKDKINWAEIGATITTQMVAGGFSLTMAQFTKWIKTGELPSTGLATSQKTGAHQYKITSGPYRGKVIDPSYHTGGIAGIDSGGRTGHTGSQSQSEITANLLRGEGVVNHKGMAKLGRSGLDDLNNGRGGPAPGPGLAGLMAGMMAGMVKNTMGNAIVSAGMKRIELDSQSMSSGSTGSFAGATAEQLANASKIIGVGRSMGASTRDLIVSIMTALQESGLRNLSYGDRDSVGLFQQRAGWGSVEQRMNPAYAARKFFEVLLGIKNRNTMPLTLEAQAVQRSAFPQAYAKWEDEARAIVSGGGALPIGKGGLMRPTNGRVSSGYGYRTNPITGKRELHNGIDLASPSGTPIHATQSGRVAMTAPVASSGGYGNYTILQHAGGLRSGYGHQSKFGVKAGQNVSRGDIIGLVGSTGLSTGPHLHFQLGYNGKWQDPKSIMPGLAKGGITLNTGFAKLHPQEAVLTKPLTKDLTDGIENMAGGGINIANLNITTDSINSEIDFKRALKTGIKEIEKDLGLKRRLGGN